MTEKILGDAADGPGGNPEPLSDDILLIKGRLGEDVLFGGIWDVVSVSHDRWCRGGKEDQDNDGWHRARWGDRQYETGWSAK